MADSSVTISSILNAYDAGGNMYEVSGVISVGASPLTYATGGIAFPLNNPLIKASRTPLYVMVYGIAGYQYTYIKGTDVTNGKLMIRQCAAATNPMAELSTAAIPAAVSGDTITFIAVWKGPGI